MISAEAPILFAKACELFILDITTRANFEAETENRSNVEREDFVRVFEKTPEYDFPSYAVAEMEKKAQAQNVTKTQQQSHQNQLNHQQQQRHQSFGNISSSQQSTVKREIGATNRNDNAMKRMKPS